MLQCISALAGEFRSAFKSFIAALTPLCHTSGHLPVASRALYLTASGEPWPTYLNEMKLRHPTSIHCAEDEGADAEINFPSA
jgi:hypothetical protein